MKVYSIEYSHIGGIRSKQTTSISQLFEWLEEALNDVYVVNEGIILTTEIKNDNIN